MARRKRKRLQTSNASNDPFETRKRLTARLVGNLGEQAGDIESRRAQAMFVVVDPDEVHGVRNALKRQKAGHVFDVVTRCGVGIPSDAAASPLALIDIAIPEAGVAVEIPIEIDECRHSLLEAIRSRHVMLMDSETLIGLQSTSPEEAFAKGLSMVVPLADTAPLIGALQQRVNLPLPTYRPVAIELDDSNRREALDTFISGALLPDRIAIQYRDTDAPSIIIADTDVPAQPSDYS